MPASLTWMHLAEIVGTESLCDSCAKWCRGEVARARSEWQRFMAAAPAYPERMFSGRGIVILAGGPKYLVPAWVNINMLRRTGAPAGLFAVCLSTAWCRTYWILSMQDHGLQGSNQSAYPLQPRHREHDARGCSV